MTGNNIDSMITHINDMIDDINTNPDLSNNINLYQTIHTAIQNANSHISILEDQFKDIQNNNSTDSSDYTIQEFNNIVNSIDSNIELINSDIPLEQKLAIYRDIKHHIQLCIDHYKKLDIIIKYI